MNTAVPTQRSDREPTAYGSIQHALMDHHAGHNHAAMVTDFQHRFWVSLALTFPVLALSPGIQNLLGLHWIAFHGNSYLLFGLSAVVFWYGGWPLLSGFFMALS